VSDSRGFWNVAIELPTTVLCCRYAGSGGRMVWWEEYHTYAWRTEDHCMASIPTHSSWLAAEHHLDPGS